MNGDQPLLPIACTLGPDDGAARVEEWQQVVAAHGRGRERVGGRVTLTFEAAAADQLQRLVDGERQCCGFVQWELRTSDDVAEVVITGDDESLGALGPLIFA